MVDATTGQPVVPASTTFKDFKFKSIGKVPSLFKRLSSPNPSATYTADDAEQEVSANPICTEILVKDHVDSAGPSTSAGNQSSSAKTMFQEQPLGKTPIPPSKILPPATSPSIVTSTTQPAPDVHMSNNTTATPSATTPLSAKATPHPTSSTPVHAPPAAALRAVHQNLAASLARLKPLDLHTHISELRLAISVARQDTTALLSLTHNACTDAEAAVTLAQRALSTANTCAARARDMDAHIGAVGDVLGRLASAVDEQSAGWASEDVVVNREVGKLGKWTGAYENAVESTRKRKAEQKQLEQQQQQQGTSQSKNGEPPKAPAEGHSQPGSATPPPAAVTDEAEAAALAWSRAQKEYMERKRVAEEDLKRKKQEEEEAEKRMREEEEKLRKERERAEEDARKRREEYERKKAERVKAEREESERQERERGDLERKQREIESMKDRASVKAVQERADEQERKQKVAARLAEEKRKREEQEKKTAEAEEKDRQKRLHDEQEEKRRLVLANKQRATEEAAERIRKQRQIQADAAKASPIPKPTLSVQTTALATKSTPTPATTGAGVKKTRSRSSDADHHTPPAKKLKQTSPSISTTQTSKNTAEARPVSPNVGHVAVPTTDTLPCIARAPNSNATSNSHATLNLNTTPNTTSTLFPPSSSQLFQPNLSLAPVKTHTAPSATSNHLDYPNVSPNSNPMHLDHLDHPHTNHSRDLNTDNDGNSTSNNTDNSSNVTPTTPVSHGAHLGNVEVLRSGELCMRGVGSDVQRRNLCYLTPGGGVGTGEGAGSGGVGRSMSTTSLSEDFKQLSDLLNANSSSVGGGSVVGLMGVKGEVDREMGLKAEIEQERALQVQDEQQIQEQQDYQLQDQEQRSQQQKLQEQQERRLQEQEKQRENQQQRQQQRDTATGANTEPSSRTRRDGRVSPGTDARSGASTPTPTPTGPKQRGAAQAKKKGVATNSNNNGSGKPKSDSGNTNANAKAKKPPPKMTLPTPLTHPLPPIPKSGGIPPHNAANSNTGSRLTRRSSQQNLSSTTTPTESTTPSSEYAPSHTSTGSGYSFINVNDTADAGLSPRLPPASPRAMREGGAVGASSSSVNTRSGGAPSSRQGAFVGNGTGGANSATGTGTGYATGNWTGNIVDTITQTGAHSSLSDILDCDVQSDVFSNPSGGMRRKSASLASDFESRPASSFGANSRSVSDMGSRSASDIGSHTVSAMGTTTTARYPPRVDHYSPSPPPPPISPKRAPSGSSYVPNNGSSYTPNGITLSTSKDSIMGQGRRGQKRGRAPAPRRRSDHYSPPPLSYSRSRSASPQLRYPGYQPPPISANTRRGSPIPSPRRGSPIPFQRRASPIPRQRCASPDTYQRRGSPVPYQRRGSPIPSQRRVSPDSRLPPVSPYAREATSRRYSRSRSRSRSRSPAVLTAVRQFFDSRDRARDDERPPSPRLGDKRRVSYQYDDDVEYPAERGRRGRYSDPPPPASPLSGNLYRPGQQQQQQQQTPLQRARYPSRSRSPVRAVPAPVHAGNSSVSGPTTSNGTVSSVPLAQRFGIHPSQSFTSVPSSSSRSGSYANDDNGLTPSGSVSSIVSTPNSPQPPALDLLNRITDPARRAPPTGPAGYSNNHHGHKQHGHQQNQKQSQHQQQRHVKPFPQGTRRQASSSTGVALEQRISKPSLADRVS